MLKSNVQQSLNKQLNEEVYSSLLYMALSAYLDHEGLHGMARWMRRQADQERAHMLKIYDHIVARGGRVTLEGLPAPPTGWGSALEAFDTALSHECQLSEHIGVLTDLVHGVQDHTSHEFLQWFVATQAKEEATLRDLVAQLRRVGSEGAGLLLIDRALSN